MFIEFLYKFIRDFQQTKNSGYYIFSLFYKMNTATHVQNSGENCVMQTKL